MKLNVNFKINKQLKICHIDMLRCKLNANFLYIPSCFYFWWQFIQYWKLFQFIVTCIHKLYTPQPSMFPTMPQSLYLLKRSIKILSPFFGVPLHEAINLGSFTATRKINTVALTARFLQFWWIVNEKPGKRVCVLFSASHSLGKVLARFA